MAGGSNVNTNGLLRQYMPKEATCPCTPQNLPLSLSPDGRWLVIVGDDATRIRDLTSTVVRSIAAMSMPEAWSPDGRWLVVLGPAGRTLLEVSSGRTWTLPVPADGNHVLPADDGQIVSVPAVGGGHTLILGRLDPVHGSPAHAIVVTATDQLTAGETIGWHLRVVPEDCAGDMTWASSLDGDRLLLGVFMVPTVTDCATTTDPGSPVGYVLASASTGQVLGRVNLPAGAGTPLWRDGDLVYASQSTPTDRISVQTVEDTGHNHRPLTSLPATSIFVLSGAVSPMVGPATR